MRRVYRPLGVAMVVLIGAGCTPQATGDPSLAVTATVPSSAMRVLSPDEALRIDAQTIAADQGWDEEATVARLQRQEGTGAFVAALAADYPDTFGGTWTGDGPDGQLFVRFVGTPPAEAQHQAEQRGISTVFVGGAQQSLAGWEARAARVHADLLAHGHPEVVTAFSVRDEMILATATRPPGDTRSDEALRAQLSEESRTPDVALTFADGPIAGYDHTSGGDKAFDD